MSIARRHRRPRPRSIAGIALIAMLTAAAAATAQSLRVNEQPGRSVSLEVSIRDFAPSRRPGPVVSLVGVTHIGDAAYYAQLEEILAGYDLVLYESVAPTGAAGAGGETPRQRQDSTLAAMRFIGRTAAAAAADTGDWPAGTRPLQAWADGTDPRLADFVDRCLFDAWGRPLLMLPARGLDEASGPTLILASLGADGVPGGGGEDADILLTLGDADRERAAAEAEAAATAGPGIQGDLATALGLAFQLTAMDYDRPNFLPSDMDIDEVNRAMAERGGSLELLEGTLDGGSLPARVVRIMLSIVRIADRLSGGAAATAMKVMLVEMLGDESVIEASLGQVDPALEQVIVGERNRRVMDDLKRELERRATADRAGERIAIFYGAAHMPDFERRLADRLGYLPTGEPRWLPAITVDFRSSPVSEAQLRQIRMMMRRQLQMMQRMQTPAPAGSSEEP
jgi:hypothetical protein